MKAKDVLGIEDTPIQASDLVSMHEGHISYFEELHNRGQENELYLRGTNLSAKQINDYYVQDRIPFPNAITADKLNRIISSQRNSRTSVKAEATKPDKEINAELLTLRFKKVEKDSSLDDVGSEIFTSGVAVCYGVAKIATKYDRMGNLIVYVGDVDYQNFIFDSNASTYEKEKASFMAERIPASRRDIRRDYGDKIADNISSNDTLWGRRVNQYWGIEDKYGHREDDMIILFEHYQKMLRQKYYVIVNGQLVTKENSNREAEEILRMLKVPYLSTGMELPRMDIVPHTDDGFDRYIFAHNAILEYEETDLEDFPYSIYQAFNFKGQIWTMTDILKPQNKFMDKITSQIDFAFGKDLKDAVEIITPWLEEGYTFEDAVKMYKEGIPIPVLRPNAVNFPKQRGINPQWLTVYDVLKQNLTEYSGGALFSGVQPGLQREAKESIAMKLKQQELIATLFTDNLRRWKRDLFKKVIWFLRKYDSEEQIIKVHGGSLTPGMLELLKQHKIYTPSQINPGAGYITLKPKDNQLTYLDTADVDIQIVEESISDSQKAYQFEQMTMIEKQDPDLLLSPTWRMKKLENIENVGFEERQTIQKEIEQAKQAQAQQAQQQIAFEQNLEVERLNKERAQVLVSDKGQQVPSIKNNGNNKNKK